MKWWLTIILTCAEAIVDELTIKIIFFLIDMQVSYSSNECFGTSIFVTSSRQLKLLSAQPDYFVTSD